MSVLNHFPEKSNNMLKGVIVYRGEQFDERYLVQGLV
jgi:hypothetical protein